MNILVVFGTRPELIKLAPVIRAMRREPASFNVRICTTAQHRDLVDPLLDIFQIQPDVDLDLMRPNQVPADILAGVVVGLKPVFEPKPDWMLIQGDTTTTIAAALAARYAGVRIAHVEAGLRTGRLDQPFPEEINRRVVGTLADLHFAPTIGARDHLCREGVSAAEIVVTGNTAIDALYWAIAQPEPADVAYLLSDAPRDVVLVTAHRRESFGAPLDEICLALRDLAEDYGPAIRIIYPVHPNPRVAGPVRRRLGDVPGIMLTPPLDYMTLVHLLKRSRLVLTDSGGLQEEAPALGKPVLVMRNSTERPEGIAAGTAKLVGSDRRRIVQAARHVLEDDDEYARMSRPVHPYGDGRAAERILTVLKSTMKRAGGAVLATLALTIGMATLVACSSTSGKAASAPQARPDAASELKIDSQLRVEINRLQNRPAPPGATGVQFDADKRALVDVRAEVTPDLIATVGAAGIVVSASPRDRSVLVWMPLLKLNDLAAMAAVHAIVPAAQAITQANPTVGQEFTLHVGGAVTVTGALTTVSLERVTDSRCPVSVTCVSAGDAVVSVILVPSGGAGTTVELHTAGTGRNDVTFHAHRIRLVGLMPAQPDTAKGLPQDRYIATFVVTAR